MTQTATTQSARPSAVAPIIWGAVCLSGLLMCAIATFVPQNLDSAEPTLLFALGGLALPAALASFLIPQVLRRQAFARVPLSLDAAEQAPMQPDGLRAFSVQEPTVLRSDEAATLRKRVLLAAQTPFIVSLALSEAVLVFGLMARFLGATVPQALPLLFFGFVLILVRFPRNEATYRAFEKQRGVSLRQRPS